MMNDMSKKEKINMDYLKCCVANKYFLFVDLTREKKTLIMKSILRDKIIKNIYYNGETNPHNTKKITFTPMGINAIKGQFFEMPIQVENLPYDWEYWQKMSDKASIELDKWHQQEKDRSEKLELENNQNAMDMIDYLNKYTDDHGINPSLPFYLIQRQGIIPRLAISSEDLCKILEVTSGDECEIKELQELIDSNNSDTKKRAILQNNKKYLEAAKKGETDFQNTTALV